jgi:hypothetical protein
VDTRVDAARGRASDAIENLEKVFQARVQKALQQVGVPTSHEIEDLSRKVHELTRSVQQLTRSGRTTRAKASAGRRARGAQPAAEHSAAA